MSLPQKNQQSAWTQAEKDRLTKKELIEAAADEVNQQLDAEYTFIDPLAEYIKAKREIEWLTARAEALKPAAERQAYDQYNETKFQLGKVTVEKKNQPSGRYSFKYDPVHAEQTAWLKAHEEKLKAIPEGKTAILTTGDGEEYVAHGPVKPTSYPSIALTY